MRLKESLRDLPAPRVRGADEANEVDPSMNSIVKTTGFERNQFIKSNEIWVCDIRQRTEFFLNR